MKKILTACTAVALLLLTACDGAPLHNQELAQNPKSVEATAPTDEHGNIVIRLATGDTQWLSPELSAAVEGFNALDSGYQVQVVAYPSEWLGSDDSGGLQTADMRLQMDILQGEKVDMVTDSAFQEMSRYDILTEKGAFVDLYSFLDGGTGIDRSELNAHILELHETDGKLCQMPLHFTVDTMGGLARYVGTKQNWTLEEMAERWEQMPEGAIFCNDSTKWTIYWAIVRPNLGKYLDFENGTCTFDSPEFISLIEYCNRFPQPPDKNWDVDRSIQFLQWTPLMGFNIDAERFGREDDPFVFVGYPSEDGSGSFVEAHGNRYSICTYADPAVQEGAWAFLSYMLSDEFQVDHEEYNGFPINNAAMQRLADDALAHNGETYSYEGSGLTWTGRYLTQALYEQIMEQINTTKRMDRPVDRIADTIIESEVSYFFKGEHTAEQTAQAIQGRMEIMISERS